eukprot:GHVH01004863.1.p1 GENE.GHVH01004863.1~~GHVH01004863.1.p1  ORF type:complete len:406 (-),score=44.82 GHVH01004863.1:1067-2284(-)
MVKRNNGFSRLKGNYLFLEIANRKSKFLKENPQANLISLGIGDTTEPLPPSVTDAMRAYADKLGTKDGYSGYPDYNGSSALRHLISEHVYHNRVSPDEIFISDGSKPDLARMQLMFSRDCSIAVQNPVYPAYVDGSVISCKTREFNENNQYDGITYLPCNPDNDFFPDLTKCQADIIYFCSPNNPTGATASREQLESLVAHALRTKSIIIFDAAYFSFIRDSTTPRSIFEIDGARQCAMETNSFSKILGFTGVRLGWTVCPKELEYEDGSSVFNDWVRIAGTFFNGPSNVAEAAAIGALGSEQGRREMREMNDYYMENARIVLNTMQKAGYTCYGGVNSPYIWMKCPEGMTSWDCFQELLEGAMVVTTPGAGFGTEGADFVRISSFAHRENVEEALARIKNHFKF